MSHERTPSRPPTGRSNIFVSQPLHLDISKSKFYRADLEFYGIDHGGASYEGRVFVNNPNANHDTPKTDENGYVGSFFVFAHGGCFGDVGHCDIRMDKRDYDLRYTHPLTQMFTRIVITEKLRKHAKKGKNEFTFTVVPIVKGGDPNMCDMENVFKCERLSLVTFDK